jgi:hypothetical protein
MAFKIFALARDNWRIFSPVERRNIALYIIGIMLYKVGIEAFNGSIIALATNRYDWDAQVNKTTPKTFERVGLLTGLNQAFQCIGSILIAPLVRRAPTRVVLAIAVFVFGLCTAVLLIVDAATGGTFVPAKWRKDHPKDQFDYYGTYNTDGMIPIYSVAGIAYGMVELIRRVIPRDIVGGNVQKLRRMDAVVHIFYEVAGTSGAFFTALVLIPMLGNNYSFIITPVCFVLAAIFWFFVDDGNYQPHQNEDLLSDKPAYLRAVVGSFYLFGESLWTGGRLLLTSRKFFWLIPGYSIAFYGHRYLENSIGPAIARRYLGHSAWSQIMTGSSNLGELLGATFVFLFTNMVPTPIPWIRVDAIMLLAIWYLPFWYPQPNQVKYAWLVGATFLPISFGWAAGDVSLAAYIQATLARVEPRTKNVSALGAVMACLYTTYIIVYAITSPLLGRYIDSVFNETGGLNSGAIHGAILNVGGVQYSIMCVVIFASTFVPVGSWAWNPKLLFNEDLDSDLEVTEIVDSKDDFEKELRRKNTNRTTTNESMSLSQYPAHRSNAPSHSQSSSADYEHHRTSW